MGAARQRRWIRFLLAAALALTWAAMAVAGEVRSLDRLGANQPRPRRRPAQAAGQPASAPSPAAEARLEVVPEIDGSQSIAIEVYALDIDHLLRMLSEAAGVTIIKSDKVTGPVTVIAPEPVPLDVAFQILNSVLEVRGFTMVRTPTGIYKVLPMAEAVAAGVDLQFGHRPEDIAPGDELITQVIPLTNVSAEDMANQLQTLLSEEADVVPTSTNSLIITDTATNVRRALTIIADAEDQLSGGLRVFQLEYYDATEMAGLVEDIILSRGAAAGARGARPAWERRVRQAGRGPQPPRPVTPGQPGIGAAGPEFCYPDQRTNSLICLATPQHLLQIEDLVIQLDRAVSLRDSYFVYPVQNLVASELASLVGPLVGASVVGGGEAAGSAAARFQGTRPGQQAVGGALRSGTSALRRRVVPQRAGEGARSGGRLSGGGMVVEPSAGAEGGGGPVAVGQPPEGAMVPVVPPEGGPPIVVPVAGPEEIMEVTGAGVTESIIAADDNTNTLLISGPPEQVDLLKQMLEELDVLPPQVHIRAIIAEVTLSRDTSLGFGWEQLPQLGPYGGEGATFDFTTNFGVGGEGSEGLLGIITGEEFSGVLNALTTDSKARILSAPSIFTGNNQQATIDISQQLPFPTGTFQTTTQAGTISTSISYRSVGIVLQVTPRVTQGDVVQLEVSISADEPGTDVKVAGLDYPSFNQRLATAKVSVQAGHTVVLGGLMREQIQRSASRVPLLGDLPLVGALFRSTTSRRLKSELLVFLTPRVIRSPGASATLTDEEKLRLPDIPRSLRGPADGSVEVEEEPPATGTAEYPTLPHYFGPFEPEEEPADREQVAPPEAEREEGEQVAPREEVGPEAAPPEEQPATTGTEQQPEPEEAAPPGPRDAPGSGESEGAG
jgi:general secretion pathway protein D